MFVVIHGHDPLTFYSVFFRDSRAVTGYNRRNTLIRHYRQLARWKRSQDHPSAAIRCCQNAGASTANPHSRLFSAIIVIRRPGVASWPISENLIVQPRPRGRGTQADVRLRPGRGRSGRGRGRVRRFAKRGTPHPLHHVPIKKPSF